MLYNENPHRKVGVNFFALSVILHCTEDELSKEEESDNCNCDILLLVVAGKECNKNISDRSNTNAVCNRVGKGHHDKC